MGPDPLVLPVPSRPLIRWFEVMSDVDLPAMDTAVCDEMLRSAGMFASGEGFDAIKSVREIRKCPFFSGTQHWPQRVSYAFATTTIHHFARGAIMPVSRYRSCPSAAGRGCARSVYHAPRRRRKTVARVHA